MREAMAFAEVGDDVYGEDPTVRRIEERAAQLTGKEVALFVPSGTMANQIALGTLAQAGDEVIIGAASHCYLNEGGAGTVLNGYSDIKEQSTHSKEKEL
jgi:threonine aldolase